MFDAILFTLGTTNGKFVCSRTPWSTYHIFYRIFNHPDYSDFSQIFLTAERTNLNKLQSMTENEASKVRMAIKEVKGIYRKRVAGTKQAFLKKEEYEVIVDPADTEKLAKMLRILGFLTQTKVYLFWKKETKN